MKEILHTINYNTSQNSHNQTEKGQQCVNRPVTLDTKGVSNVQMQNIQLPKIPLWTMKT